MSLNLRAHFDSLRLRSVAGAQWLQELRLKKDMITFTDFNIKKQLINALSDLNIVNPTEIQELSFSPVKSGKDVLGIAQTGTGKTYAYLLPILQELKFSTQHNPRVLILVPTRELVTQVLAEIVNLTKYLEIRSVGIYGGSNINTQKISLSKGCDIIVATPGRLYDLVLAQSVSLKDVRRLVIDEVDIMLDLGFRRQLVSLFEWMSDKRQNILYSATMTVEIEALIQDFFVNPEKIYVALSGTPLENIEQSSYEVPNFYTKINLLAEMLEDKETFHKVLVFTEGKKHADKVQQILTEQLEETIGIIHANKSQNFRFASIEKFDKQQLRVLVATDLVARGIDFEGISHVINVDVPKFPENYMHRIGRTGRAEAKGKSILLFTAKQKPLKAAIELLMGIPIVELPMSKSVKHSALLLPEEQPNDYNEKNEDRNNKLKPGGDSFHEKSEKNKKVNLGGSYKRDIAKKYKKPQTRGDKTYHKRQKRG